MPAATSPELGEFYGACDALGMPWPEPSPAEWAQVQAAAYGPDQCQPAGLVLPAAYAAVQPMFRSLSYSRRVARAEGADQWPQFSADMRAGWRDNPALRMILARYITLPLATELYSDILCSLPWMTTVAHQADHMCFGVRLSGDAQGRPQATFALWNNGPPVCEAGLLIDMAYALAYTATEVFGGTVLSANGTNCAEITQLLPAAKPSVRRLARPVTGNMVVVNLPHPIKGARVPPDLACDSDPDIGYVSPWEYPVLPMRHAEPYPRANSADDLF
jgi:hypothetical protein